MTPAPDPATEEPDDGVGCRAGVAAGVGLLGAALAVGGFGLWLILRPDCVGACPAWGLGLFYAAAPASALFGVVGGGIPIAWPLDAALWLVLGLVAAGWAERRRLRIRRVLAVIGAGALVYGFLLARLVEVDRATR